MGVAYEIIIISDIFIHNFGVLENVFNHFDIHNIQVKECRVYDNWDMKSMSSYLRLDEIKSIISKDKIAHIEYSNLENRNCGIFIECINRKYQYTIWCHIEDDHPLAQDKVYERNYKFYNSMIVMLKTLIDTELESMFEVVALGSEMLFHFCPSIHKMISTSKNACMWIVKNPNNITLEHYKLYYNDSDIQVYFHMK